ncbi:OVARIAN TUMOR DOMAIN-containing deubiquitinating enzyme 7 [Nymphaea colorata]|nr:OVARIAN TUMOR DOMAIN-containing deubiquitinating enzyme 7 [Nymphaea colorata]
MVQPKTKKHTKPKLKKQPPPSGKKNGKADNNAQFSSQLDALGLKIVPLVADGNCFFRGIADQLEGNEEEHAKYRHMVVEYIMKHREEFEPFIEDDVPFDEYCQSMGNDGTWAGHMEIQAASLVCHSNICIHHSMSPRWYIKNFPCHGNRMIHLSYHDGEHYNSIRLKEDPCDGPAKPIIIEADTVLSVSNQTKVSTKNTKAANSTRTTVDPSCVKIVMSGSGCGDTKKVEQILQEVNGDVDAAIEFLIAESIEEAGTQTDARNCENNSHVTSEQSQEIDQDAGCGSGSLADSTPRKDERLNDNAPDKEKKIPRNKVCPCGSRKKYKACCGAAAGRLSTRIDMNQKVVTNRMRKEQVRHAKAELESDVPLPGSDPGQLDLGALCI